MSEWLKGDYLPCQYKKGTYEVLNKQKTKTIFCFKNKQTKNKRKVLESNQKQAETRRDLNLEG